MKKLLTLVIMLAMIALFAFSTSVTAQVEAKVTQSFNIRDTGWRKVLSSGTPVTIFAYKHKEDVYSFGIYSDDYAGIIDLKANPFDVEEKQLKKLPNAQGKTATEKLRDYYKIACAKAREKAFAGKYKTSSTDILVSGWGGYSVSKNEPITIIGYKEGRDNVGPIQYFAVVKTDDARIYNTIGTIKHTIDIPLSYLPSTEDPQVKAILDREKSKIIARMEAEKKAREEEERRLAAEKEVREEKERAETQARLDSINKEIQEEKWANLRTLAPAFIEMRGWNMDSAGGIAVDIRFTNCSSQKVKYVYFRGYFLNAVGDKCRNDITGSTEWKYRGVGPISPLPKTPEEMDYAHVESWHFGNPLFYSTIAVKFRLSSVTIEYMNGKKAVLSGAELNKRVAYVY